MPYQFDETKIMTRGQRKKLLSTCRERAELDLLKGRTTWPTRSMLIHLALYSGLRVSEMANLTIEDLHLKDSDPFLHVRNSKRDKSRKVYIPFQLVKMLKGYLEYKKKSLGHNTDPGSPLFTSPSGCHAATITLMKSFKAAIKTVGLQDHFSIHCCRHTYATFLLEETQDLAHVRKQLGHENVAMTLIYADLLPERNTALVNRLSWE
jgi:site-specific recombinase XerD